MIRIVVAALAVTLGCSRPAPIFVDRIEVDAFVGGDVAAVTGAQLRDWLVAQLSAARMKVVEQGKRVEGSAPWRLRLAAGVSEPDLEHQHAAVQVMLEVRHTGDRDGFEVRLHQMVASGERNDVEAFQSAVRDALEAALRRAARQAAAFISFDAQPSDKVRAKLEAGDEAERAAAIQVLARRRDEAALAPLLARLGSDDVDELREVMGLLVELRSPKAVNPLIEAARQRGPVFHREVVFAVGAIGGSDAEAYLDLVATGHDDPLVRASAEQALAELRARKPRPEGAGR